MLAQNFKSAAALGITEPQLSALQKTLVLLETNKIIHVADPGDVDDKAITFTGHFNMDKWAWKTLCGSICCIGGSAELIGGLERNSFDRASTCNMALRYLFYPNAVEGDWAKISTAQAATALRSYLTTGDARWDLAVAS